MDVVVVQWTGTALQKVALRYSTVGLSNAIDNDIVNKISCEVAAEEQIFLTVADVIVMLASYPKSKSATLVQHLEPNEKERTHKNIEARIVNIISYVKKEIKPKICSKSEESIENLFRSPFRVDVLPHLATRKCQNITTPPIDFNLSTQNLPSGNTSIELSLSVLLEFPTFVSFYLVVCFRFFLFLFYYYCFCILNNNSGVNQRES